MAAFSPSPGHKVRRRARSERLFEALVRRFELRGNSNYIRRFSFDLLEGPPKCKSSLVRVGIPKPVYRAFQLLHHLGDERLTVAGQHHTVEVWAIRKGDQLTLLCVNHTLPNHAISTEQVDIAISNAPEPSHIYIERIDEEPRIYARLGWRWAPLNTKCIGGRTVAGCFRGD